MRYLKQAIVYGGSVGNTKVILAAKVLSFSATVCLISTLAFGQDGYFSNWFNREEKTQSEQPPHAGKT